MNDRRAQADNQPAMSRFSSADALNEFPLLLYPHAAALAINQKRESATTFVVERYKECGNIRRAKPVFSLSDNPTSIRCVDLELAVW